jgi:hypothetical protein
MTKALLFSLGFLTTAGMCQQSFGMDDAITKQMAAMHIQASQSRPLQNKPTNNSELVCPWCFKSDCTSDTPKTQWVPKKTDECKMSDEK